MTNAHVETLKSNGYELKQNMFANPGYYWVPLGDRDDHPTTFPTPEEAARHYCQLYELEPQKLPWSIVINWDDGDVAEQGTYAWAGMAFDIDDAEIEARSEMFNSYADNMNWEDEEREEKLEGLGDILYFGGSVIESYSGANIWAAPDGLRALKAIMEFIDNGTPIYPGALIVEETIKPAIARLEGRS
ncbi:hypothetical protein [Roseibium sp. Sym1]|uniref:hypothetical protein n=1 Tax=Roseibium sp. Sym1 TaxID=3016006 RepID=UPI0022B33DA9|nr:hypothetical protein [Roseibium sp. Sym1]